MDIRYDVRFVGDEEGDQVITLPDGVAKYAFENLTIGDLFRSEPNAMHGEGEVTKKVLWPQSDHLIASVFLQRTN